MRRCLSISDLRKIKISQKETFIILQSFLAGTKLYYQLKNCNFGSRMSQFSQNIGERVLRKRVKKVSRNKTAHNFKSASTAIILFDVLIPDCFSAVKDFSKYLAKNSIKTKVIGFVSHKEVPQEMLLWANFDFITKKEINWYGKPVGPVAEDFFADEPDILFVFSFGKNLSIDYLSQLSPARFKVACFTEETNDYDLMINPPGGKCKISFLTEQVKHYINMLNPS